MPFVERDTNGDIVGLYAVAQPGRADTENLPETHQEVIDFRNRKPPLDPNAPLTTEELYDMLVSKGTLSNTDRPRPKPQGQP